MRIAISILPRYAVGGMLAAALCLGGCGEARHTYIYPSPDDNVSLWLDAILSGGAAGSTTVTAYFRGGGGDKNDVPIGTVFSLTGDPIRWINNTTINICILQGGPESSRIYKVTGRDGVTRNYRIETYCYPEYFKTEEEAAKNLAESKGVK